MKRVVIVFLLGLLLNSCRNSEIKYLSKRDSTEIFLAALNNKVLVKEIMPFTDTIYLIKNNYYRTSFPSVSDYFKIIYIKNTPQSKMVNFGPRFPSDNRRRLEIMNLELKDGTLNLLLIDHGVGLYYEFYMKYINNNWTTTKSKGGVLGKREHYDFENEKWYIDLKKNRNDTKSDVILFPPEKLKK